MQADSIISNTISEEIRQKGHQSIRFAPDGFSVLVSDASYKPVFLKQFTFDSGVTNKSLPSECGRRLEESNLLNFEGETVIILDSMAVTAIPKGYFDETLGRAMLEKMADLDENDQVYHRFIKDRNMNLLFAAPEEIEGLKNRFPSEAKVIHVAECLVSLSDQVKASDHQRGVVMAEVQSHSLDLLVIQEDRVRLLNRYTLNDPSDFIYHTLNTLKQLEMDRETIPVYLSGIVHDEHELYGLLKKYIRYVRTTPYYLEDLSRVQLLQYMILSEGSKCA